MKKIGNALLGLCIVLCSGVTALAQKPAVVADSKPGWHRIGGLQASFKKQNEAIHIMGNDEFTALKLRVEDGPIHIERMQVFYESGDMENIDVKKEMQKGESSGALQLKHAGRDISKISFTYHSAANNKSDKAEIEIYGLKTNATASDSYDKKVDKAEHDIDKAKDKSEHELKEARDEAKEESKEAAEKVDHKTDKAESDIEKAAEKTGDQISETAAKTAAEIDDKRLDTKVGPDGQVIYISDDARYYYINEEGKKVYVTEFQLKDKD
jgi:vacuolar-type H+-ATPase subunit H